MKAMRRAADRSADFVRLYPPAFLGEVTVLDVLGAKEPAEHKERVERWVKSVWERGRPTTSRAPVGAVVRAGAAAPPLVAGPRTFLARGTVRPR